MTLKYVWLKRPDVNANIIVVTDQNGKVIKKSYGNWNTIPSITLVEAVGESWDDLDTLCTEFKAIVISDEPIDHNSYPELFV